MKILNRPMFRMGGPIKEGIMNGIQEPKRGRVDGPGSYGGDEAKIFANVAKEYVPPNFENQIKADQIKDSQIINKDYLQKKFNRKYLLDEDQRIKSNPLDFQFQYMTPDKYINEVDELKRDEILSKPEAKDYFFDKFVTENYADKIQKQKNIFESADDKRLNKTYGNERLVGTSGAPGGGDPEMSAKPNTVEKVLDNTGLNDGTGNGEGGREKNVKSILEKLGYARSQKNALYDALIKGGRRIATEGLDKKGLVNDLIMDTSTSYDKPEKIREAAELMQVQQDLKLEGIRESKVNALEEKINYVVNNTGMTKREAIDKELGNPTSSTKAFEEWNAKTKDLPSAVRVGVEYAVDRGEFEKPIGVIDSKKYKEGKDFLKTNPEAGNYIYKGRVISISDTGKATTIKTFYRTQKDQSFLSGLFGSKEDVIG